jgi:hypothetical protein
MFVVQDQAPVIDMGVKEGCSVVGCGRDGIADCCSWVCRVGGICPEF